MTLEPARVVERDILVFHSSTQRWLFGSAAGLLTLVLCPVGVGLVLLAARWWQNLYARYTLTTERLIIDYGIVQRRRDEIELYRIKDIVAEYSFLAKWQDMASIAITSSDPTTRKGPFVIRDVPAGLQIREQIRTSVMEQQRLRRMRPFDVDVELR